MKNLFKLVVVLVSIAIFASCSPEELEKSSNDTCNCVQTIEINEPNGGSLLYSEMNNVETSCNRDGEVTETTTANGNVRTESWVCPNS